MSKVFVSDAIGSERLIFDPPAGGSDHPAGWKALSARYQASLVACGWQVVPAVRPEIYQTSPAAESLGVEEGDWHLAVKPIEHLRPFHLAPNVFVCDWPFPELSASMLGGFPFYDHVRLLKMADAVVCCTDFTADTLRAAGVERVITLPPVMLPPSPQLERAAQSTPDGECRFLCVADAGRVHRQLGPIIPGFAQAAAQRGGLRLTICVRGGGAEAVAELRRRVAAAGLSEGAVSVVADGVLDELLARADFLVCGDAAPGLDLRLVTAMLAGVPLVAPLAAATASFLFPAAAVPVATVRTILGEEDEPIGRYMPLTAHRPTPETIGDSMLAAAQLDAASRARLAGEARHVADRLFSLAAFKAGLERLGAFVPLLAR